MLASRGRVEAWDLMTQGELQALPLGTMIRNRYNVSGIVGRGGLGTVYRVEDTLFEKKRVYAVKELVDQSRAARKQFSQEAKWLEALNHPHIPKVHEYFEWEGRAYLVMDFIEGENLEQKLSRQGGRPLTEDQVLRWILPICDALQYLHTRKPPILHRDVKPANIIVTPGNHPVLVDLGIAKEHGHGAGPTATFIRKAGTEGYAPPEQYAASGQAGQWSDVYALGATLYELLTGCLPPTAVERVALDTRLLPPRDLNTNISQHVSDALVRALALRPSDRFQFMAEFTAALLGPDQPTSRPGRFGVSDQRSQPGRPLASAPGLGGALPLRPDHARSDIPDWRGQTMGSWPTPARSGGGGTGLSIPTPSAPATPPYNPSYPGEFARSGVYSASGRTSKVGAMSGAGLTMSTASGSLSGFDVPGAVAVEEPPTATRRRWIWPAAATVALATLFGVALTFHGTITGLFQSASHSTPQATINGYFTALSTDNDVQAWQYAAASRSNTQTEASFNQGLAADDARLGRVQHWTIVQVTAEDPNDDTATVQVWRADNPSTPTVYTITLTQFGANNWLIGNISTQ